MAFETLTKTLTEAGLAPEVVTQLVTNEKAARQLQEWHENGLRQSDYDRKMNSGKAELAAAQKAVAEQMATFEEQKKAINEQYLGALTTREQAETQLAALRAKAKTASDVYGVDLVKELFGDQTVNPPVNNRREETVIPSDIDKRIAALEDLFKTNVNFEVEMHDIVRQHLELFPDKPLVMKDLLDDAVKQRRSPTQVWDDKFGATAKRQDLLADKYRAEGAAKAKEELEKKYSGQMVNGMRTDIPLAPGSVFALNGPDKKLSAPNNRAASAAESVAGAVAAFRAGKYRNGGRAAEQ